MDTLFKPSKWVPLRDRIDPDAWTTTPPMMRLMTARRVYSSSEDYTEGDIYYKVPMPWLRCQHFGGREVYFEMSHDGQHWVPAWLPHVYDGENATCLQRGSFTYNAVDAHANVTEMGVSYVTRNVFKYWEPLFNGGGRDARDFMEAWENTPMDAILAHIEANPKHPDGNAGRYLY